MCVFVICLREDVCRTPLARHQWPRIKRRVLVAETGNESLLSTLPTERGTANWRKQPHSGRTEYTFSASKVIKRITCLLNNNNNNNKLMTDMDCSFHGDLKCHSLRVVSQFFVSFTIFKINIVNLTRAWKSKVIRTGFQIGALAFI